MNPKDLSTEQIKERLGDFEKKLSGWRSGALKYYKGIGIEDSGIREYMLSENIMTVDTDGVHYVVEDNYRKYKGRKRLLEELQSRREYAEKMEEKRKKEMYGSKQ